MVVVPAGTFRMGCLSETRCSRDELPVRDVTITAPFAIGVHEVTFAEFDRYLTATGGTLRGDERWGRGTRPAIHVSWEDAQGYLDWLSSEAGAVYRLPTEAEWEYAARAGTSTPWFPGETPGELCRFGNGADLALGRGRHNETCSDGYGRETAPVGTFEANAFGLQDTLGNVREWVEDCYHGAYAPEPSVAPSPEEARSDLATCRTRVLRGGAFNDAPGGLRSAARDRQSPTLRLHYIGFRVVREL